MSDGSSLMSKPNAQDKKLIEQIRLMPMSEIEKMNHGDCLTIVRYWRERALWLEKHLMDISSVPTDSWGWRELRKKTALEALGLTKDGNPVADAEKE